MPPLQNTRFAVRLESCGWHRLCKQKREVETVRRHSLGSMAGHSTQKGRAARAVRCDKPSVGSGADELQADPDAPLPAPLLLGPRPVVRDGRDVLHLPATALPIWGLLEGHFCFRNGCLVVETTPRDPQQRANIAQHTHASTHEHDPTPADFLCMAQKTSSIWMPKIILFRPLLVHQENGAHSTQASIERQVGWVGPGVWGPHQNVAWSG